MSATKEVTKTVTRRKPPAAGKGRPKGAQNKLTKQVKDMILGALEAKGGQSYLERQADEFPQAFMTLLGKVIPVEQRIGDPDGKPLAPTQVAPVFNITLKKDK